MKILDSRFYWETMFKYAYEFCKSYEQCQKISSLSYKHEMSQTPLLYCEIFMCRLWIIWDLFLVILGLFIYCLQLIMFQNR